MYNVRKQIEKQMRVENADEINIKKKLIKKKVKMYERHLEPIAFVDCRARFAQQQ